MSLFSPPRRAMRGRQGKKSKIRREDLLMDDSRMCQIQPGGFDSRPARHFIQIYVDEIA